MPSQPRRIRGASEVGCLWQDGINAQKVCACVCLMEVPKVKTPGYGMYGGKIAPQTRLARAWLLVGGVTVGNGPWVVKVLGLCNAVDDVLIGWFQDPLGELGDGRAMAGLRRTRMCQATNGGVTRDINYRALEYHYINTHLLCKHPLLPFPHHYLLSSIASNSKRNNWIILGFPVELSSCAFSVSGHRRQAQLNAGLVVCCSRLRQPPVDSNLALHRSLSMSLPIICLQVLLLKCHRAAGGMSCWIHDRFLTPSPARLPRCLTSSASRTRG